MKMLSGFKKQPQTESNEPNLPATRKYENILEAQEAYKSGELKLPQDLVTESIDIGGKFSGFTADDNYIKTMYTWTPIAEINDIGKQTAQLHKNETPYVRIDQPGEGSRLYWKDADSTVHDMYYGENGDKVAGMNINMKTYESEGHIGDKSVSVQDARKSVKNEMPVLEHYDASKMHDELSIVQRNENINCVRYAPSKDESQAGVVVSDLDVRRDLNRRRDKIIEDYRKDDKSLESCKSIMKQGKEINEIIGTDVSLKFDGEHSRAASCISNADRQYSTLKYNEHQAAKEAQSAASAKNKDSIQKAMNSAEAITVYPENDHQYN